MARTRIIESKDGVWRARTPWWGGEEGGPVGISVGHFFKSRILSASIGRNVRFEGERGRGITTRRDLGKESNGLSLDQTTSFPYVLLEWFTRRQPVNRISEFPAADSFSFHDENKFLRFLFLLFFSFPFLHRRWNSSPCHVFLHGEGGGRSTDREFAIREIRWCMKRANVSTLRIFRKEIGKEFEFV